MELLTSKNGTSTSRFGLKQYFNGPEDWGFCVNYQKNAIKISLEHSIAMMVKNFKTDLESTLQKTIAACVVTVPSSFNTGQRFAIKNAILATGMDVKAILNSSTASAITYVYEKLPQGQRNILIVDMGANFLDVGVFRVDGNSVETLASKCESNLGGDSFVWRLFDHFAPEIQKLTLLDNKLKARLFLACEKLKKKLSANTDARVELGINDGTQVFPLEMTKREFENISSGLLGSVVDTVEQVLKDSNVHFATIHEIILAGDGGRIPAVQVCLRDFFQGRRIEMFLNNDEASATGACYFDGPIKEKVKEIVTTDLEVECDTPSGNFNVLIERGEKLPATTKITQNYSDLVELRVGQGNFAFIHRIPKTIIQVSIDGNGLLKILSVIQRTLKPNKLNVLLDIQNVHQEKVQLIQDQEKFFAINDFRKHADLKNELEERCYSVQDLMTTLKYTDPQLAKYCEDILKMVSSNQKSIDPNALQEKCNLMKSFEFHMKELEKLMKKVQPTQVSSVQPGNQLQNIDVERTIPAGSAHLTKGHQSLTDKQHYQGGGPVMNQPSGGHLSHHNQGPPLPNRYGSGQGMPGQSTYRKKP